MLLHKLEWIFEEIKFFTTLALPPSVICLTEGLQMKLSNVFIGRVSGENISTMLSALFIGQMVMLCTAYSISEGLSASINILCSQAYGKKQLKLVGLYYYRVLLLMILICFPLFSLLISVGPIVHYFTQDNELSLGAGTYTSIYCFGFPAFAYFNATIRFLQSQNIVWGPLTYLLIGSVVNGILQYILILHYNLGIAGAACAYVMSIYLIALLVSTHIRLSEVHFSTSVEFDTELINEWFHTAKYIIPTTLQTFIGTVVSNVYPVIILLLISHSKYELAIYSILYSVWFVISLFTMGFSSAITVRVGHLLGEDNTYKAKRSAIFGIVFGEVVLLVFCIGTMVLSHPLSQLFTTDAEFSNELYYNLLALSVITLTDILLLGQGVMNGCGLQHFQATLKFLFMFLLGFVVQVSLVRLFAWKAFCIICLQSLFRLLCFITCMIIVFSRNWNSFVLKTDSNAESEISRVTIQHSYSSSPRSYLNYIVSRFERLGKMCHSSKYLVLRYSICLIFGIFLFISIKLLNP